ncbi:MAG: hypothetical protein SGJ15_03995 [Bacteroidota bacterium]|nr:hypothetical protein [Bacteroidota bacterium]
MKHFLFYSFLFLCLNAFTQSDSTATPIATPTITPGDSTLINWNDTMGKPKKAVYEYVSVELTPGFILPAGNFASGDHNNILAGYAKEGFSIGANVYIKVVDLVNIMISYSRQMNSFDERSFESNALEGTKNFTLIPRSNWVNNFVLIGGSGNIALDEENFLTPRILFGMCLSKSPSYQTAPTGTTNLIGKPIAVDSEREVKFAFRIGVGLKKNINNLFYMTINPDFYYTSLKSNINQRFFPTSPPAYQTISNISLTVGVGFRMH